MSGCRPGAASIQARAFSLALRPSFQWMSRFGGAKRCHWSIVVNGRSPLWTVPTAVESGIVDAANGILRWGGVMRSNKVTLRDLGRTALSTFLEASRLLDPSRADTSRLDGVRYMNVGWTKVYALMLDGFPIYDGRVGAAMGYLVQRYCVSARLCQVPTRLRFRWGAARGRHNRNPSTRALRFPGLTAANPRMWAECNLGAAWILGEVCRKSRFGGLVPHRQLRALEAALFMIGYELPPA